jgi:hypothetical protein
MAQTLDRVVIGDPLKGKLVIDRKDLKRSYCFSGFFLLVGSGEPQP